MRSSLSYSILENITEDIYWRGFDHFKKHKVGEIKESEKNLISFVHGSELYTVEFRQGPKYLKAYCDCPYFRGKASDYSLWTRPHAKIPLNSTIEWASLTLTRKEKVIYK